MFLTSAQVIELILQYKYFILFPITVAEGPIVTMIGGMLSSPAFGYLNPFWVYIIVVVGDLVGDGFYYSLGRFGRHGFIHKWGVYLGLTDDRVQTVEDHFEKHVGKTLIIGKITHAVGGVILFAAGMGNVPFWKFIWYNFLGTLPKSLAFLLIGYFFGQAYSQINDSINYISAVVFIIVLTVAVFYFYHKVDRPSSEN